jgi:hypothetical protein
MPKRVAIVFEEGDLEKDGVAFNVFLEGFNGDNKLLPQNEWSTADFWAYRSFEIVQDILRRTGAFKKVNPKPGTATGGKRYGP